MTDTILTPDQMIAELRADGCTVAVIEADRTAPWSLYRVTVIWPLDGGTYSITREAYRDPPVGEIYRDVCAIREMQAEGYRVLMDQTTNHIFRVRVQERGPRSRHGKYNVHTTSTSGYPIEAAFEKWEKHMQEGGDR